MVEEDLSLLHFWATETRSGELDLVCDSDPLGDSFSSSPTATVKACAIDPAPIFLS